MISLTIETAASGIGEIPNPGRLQGRDSRLRLGVMPKGGDRRDFTGGRANGMVPGASGKQ